jgi:hypothetical protein
LQQSENDQLILLRSHLLNLACIENELKETQSGPKMITDDGSETVIIETLRTLQQLFKKTIYEYNKISTQLIHSSDNIVIYKIWQDYLDHVTSFLHTSVPTDYNVLKEQLHLCKIHQNLLNNQKSALMHKISVDPVVPNDFETFKDRHVDLMKDLQHRQAELERRIELWEKHRGKQLVIMEQIDDIEREKSLLQLKQLYLKSVPKLKQQITDILERVTNCEGAIGSVKKNQPNLLNFIDDITANSIRLEYSVTSQRLSNIRASLETWEGFLNRILSFTYPSLEKNKHYLTKLNLTWKSWIPSKKNLKIMSASMMSK